jgi:hypothetical protein
MIEDAQADVADVFLVVDDEHRLGAGELRFGHPFR